MQAIIHEKANQILTLIWIWRVILISRFGSVQCYAIFSQSDIQAIISAPYLFGVVTFVLFAVATPNKYGDLLFESRMTSHRLREYTNNHIFFLNSTDMCSIPGNETHWLGQRPLTRSFDVSLNLRPNQQLSKQLRHRWFETPSRSSWCHCNAISRCVCYNENRMYKKLRPKRSIQESNM